MHQPKIIIVTPWFGEFSGGAEKLARSLALEFFKRGIETKVFTTCCSSPYQDWWTDHTKPGIYSENGFEVHRFSTNKTKTVYQNVISKLSSGTTLSTKEQSDFFTAGINSTDLVASLKKWLDKGWEVIATPFFQGLTHSVINSYPKKVSLVPCFHDEPQFYWPNTLSLINNCKYIFFNTPEEKDLTIKQYGLASGRKVIEAPVPGVGVDTQINSPVNKPRKLPQINEKYFVYVGKKDRGKNVDTLCSWFDSYVTNYKTEIKLVLVGNGDTSLVPPKKHFVDLGFISEEEKQYILKNSLGIINLSENESFSIVIMEAWLQGVPALVSQKCQVTTGHCRRSNAGLYINNESEFCVALDYLHSHPEISSIMGANGRDYVIKNYSYDHVLEKYLKEFQTNL